MFFAMLKISFSSPFFFFFNDTATTEIYTLSLHDALPISCDSPIGKVLIAVERASAAFADHVIVANHIWHQKLLSRDRKSTRLNSSHDQISYAVFCLKKKKN